MFGKWKREYEALTKINIQLENINKEYKGSLTASKAIIEAQQKKNNELQEQIEHLQKLARYKTNIEELAVCISEMDGTGSTILQLSRIPQEQFFRWRKDS